jgi:hypothetical protein
MTAEDIEKAVEQLPPRELARFRAWFDAFDSSQFDAAIERDAQAGKLDGLAEKAWRSTAPEVRANCKARVARMSHRVARRAPDSRHPGSVFDGIPVPGVAALTRATNVRKPVVHELVNVYLSPSPKPRLFCSRPVRRGSAF